MNQGPISGRFIKKTRGQKSRATVPLKRLSHAPFFMMLDKSMLEKEPESTFRLLGHLRQFLINRWEQVRFPY
jgi:hypothetical protein